MPRDTGPALDVLARAQIGERPRALLVGAAFLGSDDLGRRVLLIELGALPSDGRCYLALQEVLALAGDEEAARARGG